jgi:cytochrome bd-type quinol oxidase subunit 2
MKHGEKIAPVTAAFAALSTLVCCLPVGFAAAAASASLAAVVSSYRWWFLAASGLLLIVGAVQVSRARRACATDGRASRVLLAFSAGIVVLVALFPQVLAGLLADWLP